MNEIYIVLLSICAFNFCTMTYIIAVKHLTSLQDALTILPSQDLKLLANSIKIDTVIVVVVNKYMMYYIIHDNDAL